MAKQEHRLKPISKAEARKDYERRMKMLGLPLDKRYTEEENERIKEIFTRGISVSDIIIENRRRKRGEIIDEDQEKTS